jgi:outer membrane receptor protein involved in Fe transport
VILRETARADDSLTAAPAPGQLPSVLVEATAIPGTTIDIDKVPGNVQVLDAGDLSREGAASLTRALNSGLSSVNVNDNLDDPFQSGILYRGFEASPVLGTPEGLAVYQNGVRINEAFGDTVNWDLIPDLAIDRVEISSASPVYGLNALGGGVSVTMKNGFTYQGSDLEVSGGSFGQHSAAVQYGVHSDHLAFYVAGRGLDQTGWRLFSDDVVRQWYAVVSARNESGSLDLSYAGADNRLNGQGAAPIQELNLSRGLVFTGPQANDNRLDFLTLNGNWNLTDSWAVQPVLYYRQYQQTVANGNTTNYTACTTTANSGSLCQQDGVTPVTNAVGTVLPDISDGGTVAIGENDFESINAYGRGAALQTTESAAIVGHDNRFAAGATLDYALVNFHSGAEIGVINSQLVVQPSDLIVATPEDSYAGGRFGATPVSLRAADKTYGFYATDTFDLVPTLALTASGRYNVTTIDLHDQLGTNLTGDNRFTHFNPAMGLTYQWWPALTAYAGAAANARTPTASEIECSNPLQPCLLPSNLAGDPPTLRQVIAKTVEFGLRGRADPAAGVGGAPRTTWNLGVFRTSLHDDIYGIATSVSQGFFQNIGDTRREGIEAGIKYATEQWSVYANYSYVAATFESALTLPSPSNPHQDANGDIQVAPGDRLPGIPRHRLKSGIDYHPKPELTLGGTLTIASPEYYFGDESNQYVPLAGYHVVGLHAAYRSGKRLEMFASIDNLLDAKYATYGILSDPTGVGAPGVPADGVTNGPGVDNRFQSPAAPFSLHGGVRVTF